jgi:hypothetical protein
MENSAELNPPTPPETPATPPAPGAAESASASDDTTSGDETINVHDLIVQLDPDIKGKFEPLSGLMLLNADQDDYADAFNRFATHAPITPDEEDLIGTINHETYHGLQAAASGYYYDKQRRLFAAFNTPEPVPEILIPPDVQGYLDTMRKEAGNDPALNARTDRAEAVIRSEYAIRYFDTVAAPDDNSIFGALHPAFFRLQDQLDKEEGELNSEGLSTQGILEGSAVAFAHQVMRPHGNAEQFILASFAETPPVYRQLYDWTTQRVASRALELILPTTALALCYTRPNNAYAPLLQTLATSEPGKAIAAGQSLMANLPVIPAAGPILGTALDVRRRDPSFKIYDKFLDALATPRWSFDAYGLLADTANMDIIDTFPFSLVTNSDFQILPSAMTFGEFAARMYLTSLVLRKFSRRLEEEHIRELQVQWMQDVINNFVEGK